MALSYEQAEHGHRSGGPPKGPRALGCTRRHREAAAEPARVAGDRGFSGPAGAGRGPHNGGKICRKTVSSVENAHSEGASAVGRQQSRHGDVLWEVAVQGLPTLKIPAFRRSYGSGEWWEWSGRALLLAS